MSTFEGKFQEESLDFIRADDFQRRNYDGTSFFLSHFHTDHFRGIFDESFLKVLTQDDSKMLYCSTMTKVLVLNKPLCKIPSEKIVAIEINAPILLQHDGKPPVLVTAVPAGHCPGSVMFLFEQGDIRVLYTGDFRIDPADLCKIKPLRDCSGEVKKINSLYLDTTFCDPKFLSFPSRTQTLEDLVNLIKDWLEDDLSHEIGIWYNSYHGLEPLLIQLSNELKTYVWIIDAKSYNNYSCIAELHDVLCRTKDKSRIHFCSVETQGNCFACGCNRAKTKTIKPCAQSFPQTQLKLGRLKEGFNVTRVAYSMHCSLEELVAFVKYISPEKVYPCAIPRGLTAEKVLDNLKLDVEKLKALENKENQILKCNSESPPKKRRCSYQDVKDNFFSSAFEDQPEVIDLLSDEESEARPLSESDLEGLDSPPL